METRAALLTQVPGEWEVCTVELDEPRQPSKDVPRLLGLWRNGQLRLEELVSQRYELDAINKGYADMHAGRNIRGLVVFGEG